MRLMLLGAAMAAVVTLCVASLAAVEGETKPSWMTVDQKARLVGLNIIAAWNPNNGGLNYNGYYSGDMTVVLPVGWSVEIQFKNQDAMLPHSLVVTKAYAPDEFPDSAGIQQVAIPRAYTDSPEEGIPSPKTDTVRFMAGVAGNFDFLCGAPGHGHGGMWTKLKVDPNATEPQILVAEGAEPGRP
jgi:hypothetical protein